MGSMYQELCKELPVLGYFEKFDIQSFPLVKKLFNDLKVTTENLQKYMKIAQNAIEERNSFQKEREVFKFENTRLVQQNNNLQIKVIELTEEKNECKKDLKIELRLAKAENDKLILENEKLKSRLEQFQLDLAEQGDVLFKAVKTGSRCSACNLGSAMALAEKKISQLSRELQEFKKQNIHLIEENENLLCRLNNCDKELEKLKNKDHCKCLSQLGISTHRNEVDRLEKEKQDLEIKLKETINKQHEAMKRALNLAEKNKLLEKEMKDLDQIALEVEADCNTTVKNKTEKIKRLQCRMQTTIQQLQSTQDEYQSCKSKLEELEKEKKSLQTVIENSAEEKKELSDKVQKFSIIEHDLNMEIDRLTKIQAEQKRKIIELESQSGIENKDSKESKMSKNSPDVEKSHFVKSKVLDSKINNKKKTLQKKTITSTNGKTTTIQNGVNGKNVPVCITCCECASSKHINEILDKELEFRKEQSTKAMDNLQSEKQFYMSEFHKVLDEIKNIPTNLNAVHNREELTQKLIDRERTIISLEHANKMLSQEKYDLMARLEKVKANSETSIDICNKSKCKRIERERDVLRIDIEKFQDEIRCLNEKLNQICDLKRNEIETLRKSLNDAENQIIKLERERRELIYDDGSKKNALTNLEDQCIYLKEQLKICQNELNQQKTLYSHLKTLHEQSDNAIIESKRQLHETEIQLTNSLEQLKLRDSNTKQVDNEILLLKNDIETMKNQLTVMDREKDELLIKLDEKTEKMALLEIDVESKNKHISSLETTITELKMKLSVYGDENTSNEIYLRNCQSEISTLKHELESVVKIKQNAIQENKRLQDDLAALTNDCRNARNELDISKRQVDDLKRQLQQYVAEVKRTEDLITQKEIERSELLDQFKCLSQEANILENSNHTLETEASQSRVQLSVALDHANELERKLSNKECIIRSYEKQIADLTTQVASLEMQIERGVAQYQDCERELNKMRDLCLKLDKENEDLKYINNELKSKNFQHLHSVQGNDYLPSGESGKNNNVEYLQENLNSARHESMDLRLLNNDLQDEIIKMKSEIRDLNARLASVTNQLGKYQEKENDMRQETECQNILLQNYRARDNLEKRYPSF